MMVETEVSEANASDAMAETPATLRIEEITADLTEDLRHLVLWPDKPLDYVRLAEDEHGHHFGAFVPHRDAPVAVISVFFERIPHVGSNDRTESGDHGSAVRFRKFACHPQFQGQGIGTNLLRYTASWCSNIGATVLWCDARRSSTGWYEKRGLVPFGDTFFKDTVEYIRMKMLLEGSVRPGTRQRGVAGAGP